MPPATPPEYACLLDAIVPLPAERAGLGTWDDKQWGQTLRIAAWHRLSPALFSHLDGRAELPGAVRSALERSYLASAARSMYMASALSKVLDALGAAGIPALLLKGAALVRTAYPDPAHREMLDLDILVPFARIEAATASLAELGYAPDAGSPGAARPPISRTLKGHHDEALVGDDRLLAVELHRHILIEGEGTFDIEDFWRRARQVPDASCQLPAPEDLLLHVCLHFTRNRLGGSSRRRHTGSALAQIYDIQRIVESEALDWDSFVTSARAYRIETPVFLALFASRTLGVAIPAEALSRVAPKRFDPRLGERLVSLRVLRSGEQLPVRSLRWMLAPSREVLSQGWNADSTAALSLARAYLRRARAHVPEARSTLRRPYSYVQDQRLNAQIQALEEHL